MEVLPWIFSSGWASGLNGYAVVLLLGLFGRFGGADGIPPALMRTDVLIAAAVLTAIDLVADKIPYLDSTWDSVHTVIRPGIAAAVGALMAGQAGTLSEAAGADQERDRAATTVAGGAVRQHGEGEQHDGEQRGRSQRATGQQRVGDLHQDGSHGTPGGARVHPAPHTPESRRGLRDLRGVPGAGGGIGGCVGSAAPPRPGRSPAGCRRPRRRPTGAGCPG